MPPDISATDFRKFDYALVSEKEAMMRRASWWMPVLLFSGLCLANEVGDFAPLAVGNTWIYQGFRTGKRDGFFGGSPIRPFTHDIRRRIQVESKTAYADSDLYRIVLVDSMYHRNVEGSPRPDSIAYTVVYIAEHSGILYPDPSLNAGIDDKSGSTMLFECFRSHTIDSDSIRTRSIGDIPRQVAAESLSDVEPKQRMYGLVWKRERIRDIGVHLWAVHHWSMMGTVNDSAVFSLLTFNSEPVNRPTALQPALDPLERRSGSLGTFPGRWRGFDAAGRWTGRKTRPIER
jgi:hypothetical protein